MSSLRAQGAALRIGLLGGWRTWPDVAAWADAQIACTESPAPELLELSTGRHLDSAELARLLAQLPGSVDEVAATRRAFGDLAEWIGHDVARAEMGAKYLYHLMLSKQLPSSTFSDAIYSIDDAFDLARQGVFGTREDATERLTSWLATEAAAV